MTSGIIKIGLLAAGQNISGSEWDDGGRSEIAQIFIWHDGDKLHAIQTQYIENGNLIMSKLHGATSNATKFNVVQFDIGSEYITGISSHCSQGSVTSLTISTNIRNRGPFGKYYHGAQSSRSYQQRRSSRVTYGPSPTSPGYTISSPIYSPAYPTSPSYHPPSPGYIPEPDEKEFKVDLGHYGQQFCGFCGSANQSGLTSIGICFKPATTITALKERDRSSAGRSSH